MYDSVNFISVKPIVPYGYLTANGYMGYLPESRKWMLFETEGAYIEMFYENSNYSSAEEQLEKEGCLFPLEGGMYESNCV